MTAKDEVYFTYSQLQIAQDKEIANKIGRRFECGDVSVGTSKVKYSKIILQSDIDKMTKVYPDTKIVASGKLGDLKYTPIVNDFIR